MDFAMMQAVYYRTVELSHIEVAVLFALAGAAKDEKTIPSPSLNTIADRAALCIRSVSRGIKSLESKGIIEVDKRTTEHGKLCNKYHVDCTKLKASNTNDCKSNMDCESNYNMSLKSLNNMSHKNNDTNKRIHSNKTQGGSIEGGSIEGDTDEGNNSTTKTHARNNEPRSLKEIFEVLRKEYKQEFPAVAKYIDSIISTKLDEGQLPEELLKELREQESKDWPGIRSPLCMVRARLRGYVPYSLIGLLRMDLECYRVEREEAVMDIDYAKRHKDFAQIPTLKMGLADAEKKIEETKNRIAEIANKIKEYKDTKCKRKSVARLHHKGTRGLRMGRGVGGARLQSSEGL